MDPEEKNRVYLGDSYFFFIIKNPDLVDLSMFHLILDKV